MDDYMKYRWFFTSSGKLVVGGKSSAQNDSLLKTIKRTNKDFIAMHTSAPGSPFSVILSEVKSIKGTDLEESAVFTACFSKAWKEGKKTAFVDVFKVSQLYKGEKMKEGTWGISGPVTRKEATLSLVLTRQKGVLRAVPEKSFKGSKKDFVQICPGSIEKNDLLTKLEVELNSPIKREEVLMALPAGGIKICRGK